MDEWPLGDDLERLAPSVDVDRAIGAFNVRRQSALGRRRLIRGAVAIAAAVAGVAGVTVLTDDEAPTQSVFTASEQTAGGDAAEPLEPPGPYPDDGSSTPLTSTITDVQDPLTSTVRNLRDDLPPVSTGHLGPGWEHVEPAPIQARTQAVAVWTGTEVLIWGGLAFSALADGAAYNPDSQAWRTLATSPLSARIGAVSVWTGEELIVVGGISDDGFLFDGAAYDPALDTWRTISTTIGAMDETTAVAWTGEEMILAGVFLAADTGGGGVDIVSYRPGTNTSETLGRLPRSSFSSRRRAFIDGQTVLIVEADADSDAMYVDRFDLTQRIWTQAEQVPGINPLNINIGSVAWTGTEVIIIRNNGDGAAYDPLTRVSTPIPASWSRTSWPAVMVDNHVFIGDIRFDPQEREWLTDVAYPFPDRSFPTVVAIDDGAFVWGGDACSALGLCRAFVPVEIGLIWTEPFNADDMDPQLDCSETGHTLTLYDHADQFGFTSSDQAIDHWWRTSNDGSRHDRADLRQELAVPSVTYLDTDGNTQLILRFDLRAAGWRIATALSCAR